MKANAQHPGVINYKKNVDMNKIIIMLAIILFPTIIEAQTDLTLKIDSILQQFDKDLSPGLSVGIVKNRDLIYNKGYGCSNLEYNIRNTDSSVFDIGSIAKQFTAACIWTLIKDGKISLDDDIRKYLPELPFWGDTIKIRHMLNHTSGLRNYASILDLAGFDYTKHFFDNQSVYELICRQKGLNNIPGEKVLYGNTPYNLLTIIVEKVTQIKFSDYAKEHLFSPLGMKNTFYRTDNTSIVKNRAVGYIVKQDSIYEQFNRIETCYGAGSLWSTINDLVIWSNLFTKKDSHYQDLVKFLTTKDTLLNGELASYSRGIMVDKYKGRVAIHHSGITKGYCSQIISLPEESLSVIILANSNMVEPESMSYKILDLFIQEKNENKESGKAITPKPKKKILQNFVGTYQEQNSCLKMEIIFRNNTLFAKSSMGGHFLPLKSTNENTLVRLNNESVKYVFQQNKFDLIVYFGATPFYFERIELENPSGIKFSDYVGEYYSKELSVTYKFFIEGELLYLTYPNNPKVILLSGRKDEFGNGNRTRYSFTRDKSNNFVKLKVASEGTVKDIEFIKSN